MTDVLGFPVLSAEIQARDTGVSTNISTSLHLQNNIKYKHLALLLAHSEVEELRLLLVGPSLGQTRFVQVAVRHAGLDGLGGRAVGEALGDVVVVQHRHVLEGGQGRSPGLLHLESGAENGL